MKYFIYFEGEEQPTETAEPIEVSDFSEGLPSGETGGETETIEDMPSEVEEVEEEQENSNFQEAVSVDYSDLLQNIAQTTENMRDLVHAEAIMIAIAALFIIIYEFFRGVSR